MIDLSQEHLLSLKQAPKELPEHPHVSTLWRWSQRGVRGHRLETVVVGGRRFTSREAIRRFIEQTTNATIPASAAVSTTKERRAAIELAERELRDAGI
jgi:hypothetical protein